MSDPVARGIVPYLLVEDLDGQLAWLERAFGFEAVEVQRDAEGSAFHAEMEFRGDRVMLGCPGSGYRNPAKLGASTQCQYVYTDDASSLFSRARSAGAEVLEEPTQTPYGHLRFAVRDPEGHQWYFAQPGAPGT